ncbi:hypothetical protein C0J52_04554 [Blattella germanica]|nr:hypothetical protein C0J52_04554 [Blattella germanica]
MLPTHQTWLLATFGCFQRRKTQSVVAHSLAAIASAIFQWSNKTYREAFAVAMQSWRRRCEKCVRLQGDYVEK